MFRKYPVKETINPGVQKPHCVPPSLTIDSWIFVSPLPVSPSIVTTCLPCTSPRGIRHEFTVLYLTLFPTASPSKIVHAPQSPSRHPSLVPINFRSFLKKSRRTLVGDLEFADEATIGRAVIGRITL